MPRIYIRVILLLMIVLVDCKKKKKKDDSKSGSSLSVSDSFESSESNEPYRAYLFDFTGDFMKQFVFQAASLNPTKSMICSPLSAILPLGKLIFGATGKTKEELYKTIGMRSMTSIKEHFKSVLKSMRHLPGVTLSVASRIYINKELKVINEFANNAIDVFKSSVERVNTKDPKTVVPLVNGWIKSQTEGKITDLLEYSDVPPNSNLIVANAVHFKGEWKHPFESVQAATFHGSAGQRAVTMMHVTNTFNYTESSTLGAKLILLPYERAKAMMLIVLPNSKTGLSLLLNQLRLAPSLLNTQKLKKEKIHVSIPKFTVESKLDLGAIYKKVGLKEIFSQYGGFEEIALGKREKESDSDEKEKRKYKEREKIRLRIDSAKHRAIIEVTERGTSAAAASASNMVKAALQTSKQFIADHPFLYFIIAEQQQLFAGTFTAG